MSLAQILVLWLGLRWWEEHDRRPTAGPLLLGVGIFVTTQNAVQAVLGLRNSSTWVSAASRKRPVAGSARKTSL